MKKLPIEQRKVSITVALSQLALGKLEIMSDRMQDSRSGIVEAAIGLYYRFYIEKQKTSSIYGEVHNAEQTDQV